MKKFKDDFNKSNKDYLSSKSTISYAKVYPESNSKRILLTGGAGFIGSHVAEALLKRGDEVIIVDEINDYYDPGIKRSNINSLIGKWNKKVLRIYEGDICDEQFISSIFMDEKPKWIIHLAARAGVRASIQDPFVYINSNIEGTTRLLELARIHGNNNFIFASSSSVYGGSIKKTFSETDTVDFPLSPYAASKKTCELMAYTYHYIYNMNISGLRFFTVYGPRGRPDMAPFKFVDRIFRGVEIQQFGDGKSCRDYTYIDDIVDGIILSLDRPMGYQIFNLGNGCPIKLQRFIKIIEEILNKKAIIKIMPDQPGDVPHTCADISKAKKMLGYNPKMSFEEGINSLVNWYLYEYQIPENNSDKSSSMIKSNSLISFTLGSHNETTIF